MCLIKFFIWGCYLFWWFFLEFFGYFYGLVGFCLFVIIRGVFVDFFFFGYLDVLVFWVCFLNFMYLGKRYLVMFVVEY